MLAPIGAARAPAASSASCAGRALLEYLAVAIMREFGLDDMLVAHATQAFLESSFGPVSFSLPEFLRESQVRSGELKLQGVLNHFAGRIPAAPRPPS